MNDIVRCTNRAGKTIGWCRHCGIAGADQRQVCIPGCLSQMRLNRLDCKGAGNLAGVPPAHSVTDDIESDRRVGHKAILVMGPLKAGMGFGAMQLFESQTTPPSGRETPQTGTELGRELIRASIAVKQLFL
jgi:hypothetical protein